MHQALIASVEQEGKVMIRLDGQYLTLFMAALLFIWLGEERRHKEFMRFSLAMLMLLLIPPTAELLVRYQTAFYENENIWRLLPLTALLAYGLVLAETKIMMGLTHAEGERKPVLNKKRERLYEVLLLAAFTVLLCICGTFSLGKRVTEERNRMDGLPEEADILTFLDIPKDDFKPKSHSSFGSEMKAMGNQILGMICNLILFAAIFGLLGAIFG